MRTTSLLSAALLLGASSAFAIPAQPVSPPASSPALLIARRVAAMENNRDLPSRAVWLGKKAAQNTRLAYTAPASPKLRKKHLK
jgi:hypothetical protein